MDFFIVLFSAATCAAVWNDAVFPVVFECCMLLGTLLCWPFGGGGGTDMVMVLHVVFYAGTVLAWLMAIAMSFAVQILSQQNYE